MALICPQDKIWIWRHPIGQVILPDGVKIKPIDGNEHILRWNKYWYYGGWYEEEVEYFLESTLLDIMKELNRVLPKIHLSSCVHIL